MNSPIGNRSRILGDKLAECREGTTNTSTSIAASSMGYSSLQPTKRQVRFFMRHPGLMRQCLPMCASHDAAAHCQRRRPSRPDRQEQWRGDGKLGTRRRFFSGCLCVYRGQQLTGARAPAVLLRPPTLRTGTSATTGCRTSDGTTSRSFH